MAGGSEKKHRKENEATLAFRSQVTLGVLAVYVLWRIGYHNDSFGWKTGCALLMVGVALLLCFSMFKSITTKSLYGIKEYEHWNDLFYVSITTLVLATFTDYGWLLFLVVPAYGIYALMIRPCLNWIFQEDQEGP